MEAECYSPGFIRTELKAGKFVSTCSLLISFSGLGKQSFSDSKKCFWSCGTTYTAQMTSTLFLGWYHFLDLFCKVVHFYHVPCPQLTWERVWLAEGTLTPPLYRREDAGDWPGMSKHHLEGPAEKGGRGNGAYSNPSPSRQSAYHFWNHIIKQRVTLLMAFRSCPPLQHMYKCEWWLLTSYPNVCLICCF